MKQLLPNWGSYTEGDIGDFCGTMGSANFHKIKLIFDYTEEDLQMCSDLGDLGNFYSIDGDPELWEIGGKVFLENLV